MKKYATVVTAVASLVIGLSIFPLVKKFAVMFAQTDAALPQVTRIILQTHGAIAALPLLLCGLMTGMTLMGPPQTNNRFVLLSNIALILIVLPFLVYSLYLPLLQVAGE